MVRALRHHHAIVTEQVTGAGIEPPWYITTTAPFKDCCQRLRRSSLLATVSDDDIACYVDKRYAMLLRYFEEDKRQHKIDVHGVDMTVRHQQAERHIGFMLAERRIAA